MAGSCGIDWLETGLSCMNQQPCALSVDDSAATRDTLVQAPRLSNNTQHSGWSHDLAQVPLATEIFREGHRWVDRRYNDDDNHNDEAGSCIPPGPIGRSAEVMSATKAYTTQRKAQAADEWVCWARRTWRENLGLCAPEVGSDHLFLQGAAGCEWLLLSQCVRFFMLIGAFQGYHDLKQLPYNGKKTKPAKLRKDYWSPMATIEFPQGQGAVGRTVFQKLRELKHLHEVQWHEDLRYKSEKEYTKQDKKTVKAKHEAGFLEYKPLRTVKQRGKALNAQKGNAIADMAVVLAGEGAGNRVLVSQAEDGAKDLVQVTVSWANDQDRNFAEEWSTNVTHDLFEEPSYVAEAAALQTTGAQAQPSPA